MNKRISLYVAVAVAVVSALGGGVAISAAQAPLGDANASRWGAEKIFEYDGCSVYRFNPGLLAHWVYFTKCKNARASSAGWSSSSGKATHPRMVPTSYVDS